jgi:cytochrome P450
VQIMTSDIPAEHAETIVDPRAYADGRIHETYRWLRANDPVGRCVVDGYDPFWVITKYADLRAISLDNRLFPYGDRPSVLRNQASDGLIRTIAGGKPTFLRTLVQMDAPEHMKYRLLTQAWFMPKSLKSLNARIGELADDTVAQMRSHGTQCDFVVDVALTYPLRVIMEILGVPEDGLPLMLRLTQEIFAPQDPDSETTGIARDDPALLAKSLVSVMERFGAYFSAITEDRRINPRNDVASIIANAVIDGARIDDDAALGYYITIATAGHDTTSSSTAAAMWALATQPGLLGRLQADPALLPAFVEEAIRWATPVKTFMRSVAEDIEFGGKQLRQGDWIMLCYASGDYDEAVFERGEEFDIDRPARQNVAFGYGVHSCLGQFLARTEMTALYERLIPALRSVTLDGGPAMSQSFFVNGFKRLPIKVEWAD